MTKNPIKLPGIRIITVSGRIASGSTSLAGHLAEALNWRHIEGGEVFWEAVRSKMGLDAKDTNKRPDVEDRDFDESLKKVLETEENVVLETKLAGFNAQGTDGVYKILVVCEDKYGVDQTQIRIDRLLNREGLEIELAKEEVLEREKNDLEKWRRMYAEGDPNWVYYDPKYYDLVINTFDHGQEAAFKIALEAVTAKR